VTLTIYNILGEEVRKMAVGNKPAGKYTITWDGADDSRHSVSSGVYFYKITAGTFAGSKKMILLK
jgi:flagellar hook assembly protein FlgD